MTKQKCPKCVRGTLLYEIFDRELWVRCLCGFRQVVYTEREDGGFTRHVVKKVDVCLPKSNTKLYRCLMAVRSTDPDQITTGDVSVVVGMASKDAASFLMVLQHKGLIEKVQSGRGVVGGSTWVLSKIAKTKLGVR